MCHDPIRFSQKEYHLDGRLCSPSSCVLILTDFLRWSSVSSWQTSVFSECMTLSVLLTVLMDGMKSKDEGGGDNWDFWRPAAEPRI